MTHRFRGHYEGDSQEYRDRAELDQLKKDRDPLNILELRIRALLPTADTDLANIRQKVTAEVTSAAAKARQGTQPERSRIFDYVYA
jgi:TPP-dependent pyruvate/acetoin dehydrogenase alpha subunit